MASGLLPAARAFVSAPEFTELSEHIRDAALAASAAHAFVTQAAGWHNLLLHERSPFFPGGTEVAYWFPKQRT
ncbi:hypothetical protein KBY81_12015 [Cyanobium sp. Lug-B]|nr:hypothetical protein [Cyanobium sp. Lug-B]